MRQLNLLLFFALCLGLALFSIENTQTVTVNLIPGQQFDAPLSIELLVAAGLGALLAWLFTILDSFQRQVESFTTRRRLKKQSKKIEKLEQTIADLQTEEEETVVAETKAVETKRKKQAKKGKKTKEKVAPKDSELKSESEMKLEDGDGDQTQGDEVTSKD